MIFEFAKKIKTPVGGEIASLPRIAPRISANLVGPPKSIVSFPLNGCILVKEEKMSYLVALSGLFMLVMSVVAMLGPRKFVAALTRCSVNARFFLVIGIRLLLGIILLFGASQTRFPTFVSVIGGILVAAAVILFLLGRAKVDAMVQWWFYRTSTFMRAWALVGVVLGAVILYASLGNH